MDDSLFWTGVVVAAAGAATGWIAIKVQREHREWCEGKERALGAVSRITRRRTQGLSEDAMGNSTGTAETRVSVVRFRASDNIEYEIDAPEIPLELGRVVEVAYDAEQPSGGRAVERAPKIAIPVFLVLLGAGLAAFAASRG